MLLSIVAIILIDLVLAGDNAVVIAMAARRLPAHLQMRAMFIGTGAAIAMRILATLCVLFLLKVPGLMLLGGGLLLWIAYGLTEQGDGPPEASVNKTIWQAARVIVVADLIMSLDNMLGVAGAAKGDPYLVVAGLMISIPIMIFGSAMILRLLNRFPWLVYVGASILAWTAASMILHEPLVRDYQASSLARVTVYGAAIAVVLIGGLARKPSYIIRSNP